MRRLLTLAHQGTISLNTVVATLTLANLLPGSDFGAFALAYSAALVALGVNRCLVTDPAIISVGEHNTTNTSLALGYFASQSRRWIGLVIGETTLAIVLAALTGHPFLIVASLLFPLYAAADSLRYVNTSIERELVAAAGDIALFVATVATAGLLFSSDLPATYFFLGSWGLGPLVAVLLTFPHRGWKTAGRRLPSRSLSRNLLIDYMAQTGLAQAALFVIALILSVSAIGDLRLIQTLFGMASVALQAVAGLGLATAVRAKIRGTSYLDEYTRRAAGALLLVAIVNLLLIWSLPTNIIEVLVGGRAAEVVALAPFMFVFVAAQAYSLVPMLRLRASGNTRAILQARLICGPAQLLAPIVLARFFGTAGALCGLAAAALSVGIVANLLRYHRRR